MFQSRMFPGEKRFRLGSACTAVMEVLFHEAVVGGRSAYSERMRGKLKKRRGTEKWKQGM